MPRIFAWVWPLFLLLPLAEIVVFWKIAAGIGFFPALGLLFLGGVVGIALLQRQGLEGLRVARARARGGALEDAVRDTLGDFFDQLCVIAAAFLLILPGFLSDIVALALLLPASRSRLRAMQGGSSRPGGARDSGVIEGEYERLDEPTKK